MALSISDIKFYKSKTVTDTSGNGGRIDRTKEVVSGIKYNLFPRVSYSERTSGVTRYRKEFIANMNDSEEVAYGVLYACMLHSGGQDRFYVKLGTHSDTQADLTDDGWTGGGPLYADVSAGSTSVQVNFDSNDYDVPNGASLVIANWNSSSEEFEDAAVLTAANVSASETVGTGDGSTTSFSATLATTPVDEDSLEIAYTIGGTDYTATDDGDGNISGTDCTGTIDYDTGALSLTFSTAPDNGSDITATYYQRCATWSGNVCTISLDDQVPNAYTASDAYVGVALSCGDLTPSFDSVSATSTSGTFDDSYLEVYNQGTVYDQWTITFDSATTFTCSGANEGSQVGGSISSDYAPLNPDTNTPYFTIESSAWGGTWASGDTVRFNTYPAAKGIWYKEVVPAGTPRAATNLVAAHYIVE